MSPSVLFIDDDASVRALASVMLECKGYRLLSALSAEEADRVLKSERVDLIICDIMMPKEDGIAYTRRLRQEGVKTPILILSALGQPDMVQRAIQAGANEYLVKPFDIGEFERLINAFLPKRPAQTPPPPPKPAGWLDRITRRKP